MKKDNRGPSRPKLVSDEELARVTVGERKPHNGTIFLAEYNRDWPVLFEREARRIKAALGPQALLVEHVGSTSVPGLCAKPILDILLVVPDSAKETDYLPALRRAGYTLRIREPDWYEHRMLKGPDTDINLHVFSPRAPEITRMLRFRDWLREQEQDRLLYKREKRRLAAKTWRHVQHYADAKSAVVEEILSRALKK